MSYTKLDIKQLLNNLEFKGLKPLQETALKESQSANEILLLAPTGSGKTLAFLLPILRRLETDRNEVQSLILAPTRELALQIENVFRQLKTGHKVLTCYGGHPFSRERQSLKHPPALLIATPGRLLDHLQRGTFNTNHIRSLVIDEYDKCLELGFSMEMQRILYHLPHIKQTMLTSATKISELPGYFRMKTPHEINFLDQDLAPNLSYYFIEMPWQEKLIKLDYLLRNFNQESTVVFCNFKKDIEEVSDFLFEAQLPHSVFYGDLDQEEREKSLLKFRNGSNHILLATDLAARGLDIPEIKNIVHFQIPSKEDTFIHRNGRTARMDKHGKVFLILTEGKQLPEYMQESPIRFKPENSASTITEPEFTTLYISAGKMHKVSKGDVLGFMCQQGGLDKTAVGMIEVKDRACYVAVKSACAKQAVEKCNQQKIKKVRVIVDYA